MSAYFTQGKQMLLTSSPSSNDVDTDVMKSRLLNVTDDYTFSAAHTSMTPVVKYSGTTDQTLTSSTGTNGVWDAADPTFTSVAVNGTRTVGAVALFKFVTNDAGSFPFVYLDGFTAVTPNGGNLTLVFDNGANKILSL